MRYEVFTRGSFAKSPFVSDDTLKLRLNDDRLRPVSYIELEASTVLEVLCPYWERFEDESRSGRSVDPNIISESDIEPVEY